MSTLYEQQIAMKNRRRVLDLEIDAYLKLKSKLVGVLALARENKLDTVSEEELSKLQAELDLVRFKTNLNLLVDSLKYKNMSQDMDSLETSINAKLLSYIDSEVEESKQLTLKIDNAKELLKNRRKINSVVQQYLQRSRTITLTADELESLFGAEMDAASVMKTGREIKDGVYEFSLNSASFQLSCQQLTAQIDAKIAECNSSRTQIDQSRQKWESLASKLSQVLVQLQHIDT
ncbi:hypothetical protein OGAPHI_006487 [Ogataea philodendri]|uniref:Uncharacterized protein n=1 Tax=Ogataea philodendri TaxID=1378263 RepID=A0A9P8NY00_9ASCO|nr:uncharacterized protein OGAPHI_006487 [Ogataea philodendri]KAH3661637.1 hypothetical protein OGAPHI_006487 [Ogataea philodendri]